MPEITERHDGMPEIRILKKGLTAGLWQHGQKATTMVIHLVK